MHHVLEKNNEKYVLSLSRYKLTEGRVEPSNHIPENFITLHSCGVQKQEALQHILAPAHIKRTGKVPKYPKLAGMIEMTVKKFRILINRWLEDNAVIRESLVATDDLETFSNECLAVLHVRIDCCHNVL